MTITKQGHSTINTDHLCHFSIDGKKLAFYFDTMTARENWNFESEEDAKAAEKELHEALGTKIIK